MSTNPAVATNTTVDTKGRPVLIRHNTSGVWVGYVIGPATVPNAFELVGRRIWSWNGDALECSELAKRGAREEDKLGVWEVVEIGSVDSQLVEIRTIDAKVVEASRVVVGAS